MSGKRVVQTFKPPGQWSCVPPGIGDFIRGTCHLFEYVRESALELRVDVSQTGFADLIVQDAAFFQHGDPERIAAAHEHFEDDAPLFEAIERLKNAPAGDLYVCSNMGAWNRRSLPHRTRDFVKKCYRFTDAVEQTVRAAVPAADYAVLSVRCGDHVFGDDAASVGEDLLRTIVRIVEREIVPGTRWPMVVMSDSLALKRALADRFEWCVLPHPPGHGARGDELAVALDLCVLKGSRHNYHINAWADWWSGFSHYTSLIFEIPSTNFRSPRFAREAVTVFGA